MNARNLPYRPCVGVMLLNGAGRAWIGRRHEEIIGEEHSYRWQMPQGGIDDGEAPREAALRELQEETGARSVTVIGESREWLQYDLPASAIGIALKGRYRGQRMKWFAMRFHGEESEFDISRVNNHAPEFDAWRWAKLDELAALIVPFKRPVYEAVVAQFRALAE